MKKKTVNIRRFSEISTVQVGPSLEEQHENFQPNFEDLVNQQAAAHDRRRLTECSTMTTINSLQEALVARGHDISRSGTYLRMAPKRVNTLESRRHKYHYDIKSMKPTNSEHASHMDTSFCFEVIKSVKRIATFLGPDQVTFYSIDDKARVNIGVEAANKQTKVLMNISHPVTLPDHSFVVASRHKLIPSVSSEQLSNEKGISYKGPIYVAIRSMKHSGSNAFSHAKDMERVFELDMFEPFTRGPDGKIKPVQIRSVDGGPDENPRSLKVSVCYLTWSELIP